MASYFQERKKERENISATSVVSIGPVINYTVVIVTKITSTGVKVSFLYDHHSFNFEYVTILNLFACWEKI